MGELPGDLPVVLPETYEIEGEIARGGIGRILKAVDTSMGRIVAIKELLPGNEQAEGRFIREALVTARLEHPAIVPVHVAGRWPSGEPFYTMKLVQGRSLLQAIQAADTFAQKLELLPRVIAVADALAYAHARKVIHRDIKPSNVILGTYGETMVIDWGLAKDLGGDAAADDEPAITVAPQRDEDTVMGTIMGTPAYMSPEQARGEPVDERADVYSLGALLYHTLTGTSPYTPEGASGEGGKTMSIRARHAATVDLKLTHPLIIQARSGNVVPLLERGPEVPPDLAAIVHKAMHPDPTARYATAKELADDLRRFETGQLVSAHRYSVTTLARRWYARNRAAATVGAAALAALIAVGVWALSRVVHARGVAEKERAVAVEERGRAESARGQAETRTRELLLLQARASLDHDPTASLAWLLQVKAQSPAEAAEARAIAMDAVSRGVARYVWRGHAGSVIGLAMSHDGAQLASLSDDQDLRLWRLGEHAGPVRDLGKRPHRVASLAFSADDREVVIAGEDKRIVAIDRETGAERAVASPDAEATWITLAADGKHVLWTRPDFSVHVAELGAVGPGRALAGHTAAVFAAVLAPDGRTVISAAADRTVRVWPPGDEAPRVLGAPEGHLSGLAISPDGKSAAAAGDAIVRLFDVASGESVVLKQPYALDLAYTPNGRGLVTVGTDGVVRVWDLKSGKARALAGHEGSADAVVVAPDGRTVASAGKDRTIRVWPIGEDRGERILRGLDKGAQRPVYSPDGKLLAAGGMDGTIEVWDVATGQARARLTGHTARVGFVAWSPDGKRLASLSDDKTLRLWHLGRAEGKILVTGAELMSRMRWADGAELLTYTEGKQIVLYDMAKGDKRCTIPTREVTFTLFSPDAARLAWTDGPEVWAAATNDCAPHKLYAHEGNVGWLAFSADGKMLASASKDRTAGVFTPERGLVRLAGHDMDLYAVAFSPDGKILASTSYDQTARLWSLPSGTPLRTLRGHEQVVGNLAFTPDGKTLVTSSLDNTLRVWAVDRDEGSVLRGHDDMIWGLAMAPDGKRVASASRDGTVRLWPIDASGGVPDEDASFAAWLGQATTARVDAKNGIASP